MSKGKLQQCECGSRAKFVYDEESDSYTVKCTGCNESVYGGRTVNDARVAWNEYCKEKETNE